MTTLKLPQAIVTTDWLSAHLHHPDLVILDATIPKVTASPSEDKDDGLQIKNARFFDLNHKFLDLNNELPNTVPSPETFTLEAQKLGINKDSVVVIYDKLGIYSSPRAWWLFRLMGHEQVAVLQGGFPAWQAAGLAVEPVAAYAGEVGDFVSNFQPDLICYTDDVLQSIDNENQVVLDARSYGRFIATEPEPRADLVGGHIPNSKSLPTNKIIHQGEMLAKEKLEEIFEVETLQNKQVIFSCGSGITACVLALGAEIAGLKNTAVYDGSWTEWASRGDLPIEN